MTNQEGLLTPAQVKAMQPADMADFLRRNSGDANFQWQIREAILNRAAQMIVDLSTKLAAAAEAMVRSNHEIERLSAAHEPGCNCGKPVCVPESEWMHAGDCPAFHSNRT